MMETTTTHGGMKSRKQFSDPMGILMVLPSNIVTDIIYPLIVCVIKDQNRLVEAVDFYCAKSNHNSDFCCCYPIGLWDVERVTEFSDVFDRYFRNPKLRNFNEDVFVVECGKWHHF
jgi:hypothetical protein